MLSFFRRTLGSKLALGLLALIILAFIVTGVTTQSLGGGGGPGGTGDRIAKVGGKAIYASELEDRARRTVAAAGRQQPELDMAAFAATGGIEESLRQLISAHAIEVFGRKIGLVAGKALIDGEIATVNAFKGPNGKFDQSTFRSVLAQQRITEPQLRRELAGDVIRKQMLLPVAGAARVPVGLVTPYASLLLEGREGSVAVVPAAAMAGGKAPTDVELANWYKGHLAAYTLPERRVLRYALLGREQVAAGAVPTEADVARAYKTNAAGYAARETRTLSQVVLDSEAKAQAFAAKVKAGARFAEAAKAAGFSATDIAVGAKSQADYASLASPAVAAAAFAAPEGGTSVPAKSDFGWHVVHVDAVDRTPAKSLEQARPEIAASLVKQRQDEALATLVNGIEDELSDGASFDQIVKKRGLAPIVTPPLLQNGASPDQPGWKQPPELGVLMKPAFATSPDERPTVETIGNGERYALLGVTQVLPAAPEPLAKVRDRVAHDLDRDRGLARSKALAEAIAAKAAGGMSLRSAVAEAGVDLPRPEPVSAKRIQLAQAQGPVPPPLALLFRMTKPGAQTIAAPNNAGWFVVRLDKIVPGDARAVPSLVQGTRGQFAQVVGEEYAQQFAAAAEALVGVSKNDAAVAQLRARLTGAAPAAQ